MLWWAIGGSGTPRTPTCQTTRRASSRRCRAARGARRSGRNFCVRHRQVEGADHRVGQDLRAGLGPYAGHPAGGRAQDRLDRVAVAEGRAGLLRGLGHGHRHRVHAAVGEVDAVDAVHVGDHRVQRERRVRGQPGVHGLEAEQPVQSRVAEPLADRVAQPAERVQPEQPGHRARAPRPARAGSRSCGR